MKTLLRIAPLVLLLLPAGCMVVEEIDKAAALMPDKKKGRAEAESVATPSQGESRTDALMRESRQWWDRATSLAPTELESGIVRCRLAGEAQFMARDDCLARGGEAGRASG